MRGKNYDGFRDRLVYDFEDTPPRSKRELALNMMVKGYRVRAGNRHRPSEKQIEKAWEILKDEKIVTEQQRLPTKEMFYRVDEISYRRNKKEIRFNVQRASVDTYISGKFYRKGQFIPKQKK